MEDKNGNSHPLTLALRRRAPETNREGWYYELSDDLDCSYQAVKSWFYGHKIPDREAMEKLFKHYGRAFADEVIHAQFGWRVMESDDVQGDLISELRAIVDRLQGKLDEIEGNGKVTPIRGGAA